MIPRVTHEQQRRRASAWVLGLAGLAGLAWWWPATPPSASGSALAWRAPGTCIEVYEVRIDEHHRDAQVAHFIGQPEQHGRWLLALRGRRGPGPEPREVDALLVAVPEPEGDLQDDDARTPTRTLVWSGSRVGPAAPDLACRRRSWDLVEDALALGWPELPSDGAPHLPWSVGQSWRGASVEGRCHETPCLDENGEFSHQRPCRAKPWREQLTRVEARDRIELRGTWDDGHTETAADGGEIGILTSRVAVIDGGRPLEVHMSVEHRWSGVTRELALLRLDDCNESTLTTAEDGPRVEAVRAQLRAALDER